MAGGAEASVRFSFFAASSDSWLGRVWENVQQLFTPTKLFPTSANGAPIHLLKLDQSKRAERAQTLSLITHAVIIVALLAVASYPPPQKTQTSHIGIQLGSLRYSAPLDPSASRPSLGAQAGGGERTANPATHGFLAPRSPVQLAPPRLPDNANHPLTVTTTILDLQAPSSVLPQDNIGLPWMTTTTDSAGPGSNGIGRGKDGGMGDLEGPGGGEGERDMAYSNGVSLPTCVVCPYPVYTDEARHVKIQGTVTLRVLVGTDGKAADIRIVRGIGYGLEERAVQTVRGWKFNPARDANHRALAAWVTVEAVFRLF